MGKFHRNPPSSWNCTSSVFELTMYVIGYDDVLLRFSGNSSCSFFLLVSVLYILSQQDPSSEKCFDILFNQFSSVYSSRTTYSSLFFSPQSFAYCFSSFFLKFVSSSNRPAAIFVERSWVWSPRSEHVHLHRYHPRYLLFLSVLLLIFWPQAGYLTCHRKAR